MSDPAGLLLSVRGEARRMVPPDSAVVTAGIECQRGSKAEAVRAAAAELDSLTADLAAQGGVALDAGTGRRPLTWSAQSATTHAERAYDEKTGRHQLTGRVTAAVAVVITVRAFGLLDALGAVLAAHEAVSVHHVNWQVDWDNPAWPDVRAAAIQAAIAEGPRLRHRARGDAAECGACRRRRAPRRRRRAVPVHRRQPDGARGGRGRRGTRCAVA